MEWLLQWQTLVGAGIGQVGWLIPYLLERRRNAPRTRVRVLVVDDRSVEVEVENMSPEPNSLHHRGAVGVWTAGRAMRLVPLAVNDDDDRRLPSLEPRRFRFHVLGETGAALPFIYPCELMTLRVQSRRGPPMRVHVAFGPEGGGEVVSWLAWYSRLAKLQWRAIRRRGLLDEPGWQWYCYLCDCYNRAPEGSEMATTYLQLSCERCGRESRVGPGSLISRKKARLKPSD